MDKIAKLLVYLVFAMVGTNALAIDVSERSWDDLLQDREIVVGFPRVNFPGGYYVSLLGTCETPDGMLRSLKPAKICSYPQAGKRPTCVLQYLESSPHVAYEACETMDAATGFCGHTTIVSFDVPLHLDVPIYHDWRGREGSTATLFGTKHFDVPECRH